MRTAGAGKVLGEASCIFGRLPCETRGDALLRPVGQILQRFQYNRYETLQGGTLQENRSILRRARSTAARRLYRWSITCYRLTDCILRDFPPRTRRCALHAPRQELGNAN